MRTLISVFCALAIPAAAQDEASPAGARDRWEIEIIENPAGPNAAMPAFSVGGDGVLLAWSERRGNDSFSLQYAHLATSIWSGPQEVTSGEGWFYNWADFPTVLALDDGSLVGHWLQMEAEGAYTYGVRLARSSDSGKTWGHPITPHRDGTRSEHGFVSLVDLGEGKTGLVWLDGRETVAKPPGPMALRFTTLDADGNLGEETLLDSRVCDCCQTDAALAADGRLTVVYRDRGEEETRDISFVQRVDGQWSTPMPVHDDGWIMPACPVNGPALAAVGDQEAVAWFTGAEGEGQVLLSFAATGKPGFDEPVLVARGNLLGRVDVVLADDGEATVCWMKLAEDGALLQTMSTRPGADPSSEQTLVQMDASRLSGFPRMAWTPQGILVAWTEVSRMGSTIRTAVLRDVTD